MGHPGDRGAKGVPGSTGYPGAKGHPGIAGHPGETVSLGGEMQEKDVIPMIFLG